MRIRRLRLAGFGPYRSEQLIDFDRFEADGLFLITGKTGAGKSSILDAVCFALYASIPRYEAKELAPRSNHCSPEDPSFVELDFDVHGQRYRVFRTPRYERPKKTGTGTTTAEPRAELFRFEGEEPVGIAAKPVEVGRELSEILPVTSDQFLQIILLAQNRFQRFLLAKTDERRDLLRALFGTERFERLEAALHERRKALDAAVAGTRGDIQYAAAAVAEACGVDEWPDPDAGWFTSARTRLAALVDEARTASATAGAAADAADAELARLTDLAERVQARDDARRRLDEALAQQSDIDAATGRLADADRAARVWPTVLTRRRAQTAFDDASVARDARQSAWLSAGGVLDADLPSEIASLSETLGSLRSAIAEERALGALADACTRADDRLTKFDADIAQRRTRVEEHPARIAALTEPIAAASALAIGVADRRDDVGRAERALQAGREAERLAVEVDHATRAQAEASSRVTAASATLDSLLRRRLAEMSSELAAELTDGEPCAVCGSLDHPAPAEPADDAVTGDDIEDAERVAASARDDYTAASENARTLAAEHASALARADGHDVAELAQRLAAAEERRDESVRARTEHERMAQQRAALEAELDEARAAIEKAAVAREDLSRSCVEAHAAHRAAENRIAESRGDHETVAARVAELEVRLSAAEALSRAEGTVAHRRSALDEASVDLDGRLAEHGFADEDAVAVARLDDDEAARERTRVDAHRDLVAGARSTLDDPRFADLPAETVDTSEAHAAAAEARARRDAAREEAAVLGARLDTVDRRVAEASGLFALSEEQFAEQSRVKELASAVRGDEPNTRRIRLETFVLAGRLEAIIAAANQRLREMTGGRYELRLDDGRQYRNAESGLGLGILDQHTGHVRSPASLSGGEMFLASLSLALGLAEVVSEQAGGIRLDTLFVDEGFGSLDAETLEVAMEALDALRSGGRTVGVISHVESMKEQIPAKLHIEVTAAGDSRIRVDEAVAVC